MRFGYVTVLYRCAKRAAGAPTASAINSITSRNSCRRKLGTSVPNRSKMIALVEVIVTPDSWQQRTDDVAEATPNGFCSSIWTGGSCVARSPGGPNVPVYGLSVKTPLVGLRAAEVARPRREPGMLTEVLPVGVAHERCAARRWERKVVVVYPAWIFEGINAVARGYARSRVDKS